jgi:hypothetical protein
MITNTGKQIIAKYMIGQTPSFASHVAVGCGKKPLKNINVGIESIEISDGNVIVTTETDHGFSVGQYVDLTGLYIDVPAQNLNGKKEIIGISSSTISNQTVWNKFIVLDIDELDDQIQSQYAPLARAIVNFDSQTDLEFEMFRVPISSRGYVIENNVSKIVFTAELPTEERYEISEIGIYSAGANPSAGIYDSRMLYSFAESENWEYHSLAEASAIPSKNEPLDAGGTNDVINVINPVFQTTSDNRIFTNSDRINRNELGRFLNNTIMIAGDTAKINVSSQGVLSVEDVSYDSTHIHLDGISTDFNRQSPIDQLRLAFSVVNKVGGSQFPDPSRVLMILEFASGHAGDSASAKFQVDIENDTTKNSDNNFSTNRYFVVKKELQELIKTQDFSWDAVQLLSIYVSILDSDGEPSSDYYVALDGLRLENKSSINPLYGLTGYSVIANQTERTIIKEQNTTNYIEFRTNIGIS